MPHPPHPTSRVRAITAGVLATVTGMAAGHLVASLGDAESSPVLAVGATVIDATPTPVKEFAIRTFGTNDKPILIGSVLLGTLLLAGVIGLVGRSRPRLGVGLLVGLVVVAGAAALLRPTATPLYLLPPLATAAVGVGTYLALLRGIPRRAEPGAAETREAVGQSRRGFLVLAGATAAVAVVLGGAGQLVRRAKTRISDVALPSPRRSIAPLPTGLSERGGAFSGVTDFRTSNEDFYRVDVNLSVPVVDPDSWRLTVDGDVENQLEITFDELLEMPMIERDITMTCVSNDVGGTYVGAARWLGVPITDILERAGVGSGADQILSTAVDGFTISTPLEVATDGRDCMIVVGMNGEPLPREHGFPVRMLTPGIYGYVGSMKWLNRLTLTTYEEQMAYWTERDWAIDAPVKIASRIDTPEPLATLDAGENVLGGVAWAQQRGVAKVEVRIDGGRWQAAELGPEANVDYWRQWFFRWDAEPGQHMVAVRATTKEGEVQTAARARPFPNGSSGIQEIVVNVS